MPDPIGRYGEQSRSATEDLRTRTVAGAVAGNLTVTGILPGDRLIAVQPLVASANLVAEFEITAADTINNTGGTSSATQVVLVIWQRSAAGASGYSL